ncbi:MAG: TetR family transcriptional regulator [Streptosporangiales bacterium]
MASDDTAPSARQAELLERAYQYALQHGLTEISLRPLAAAVGSSPRVLLYLFGSKEGLLRALLARARTEELALLVGLRDLADRQQLGLQVAGEQVWSWLTAPEHRALLTLWIEGYGRSLTDPEGAWAGFARTSVEDWLAVLAATQPPEHRDKPLALHQRTLVLAVLRGALLDLLATGDEERVTAAVRAQLSHLATYACLDAD